MLHCTLLMQKLLLKQTLINPKSAMYVLHFDTSVWNTKLYFENRCGSVWRCKWVFISPSPSCKGKKISGNHDHISSLAPPSTRSWCKHKIANGVVVRGKSQTCFWNRSKSPVSSYDLWKINTEFLAYHSSPLVHLRIIFHSNELQIFWTDILCYVLSRWLQ